MLQKDFGVGAHEALYVRPSWEIENLMTRYVRDRRAEREQRAEAEHGY